MTQGRESEESPAEEKQAASHIEPAEGSWGEACEENKKKTRRKVRGPPLFSCSRQQRIEASARELTTVEVRNARPKGEPSLEQHSQKNSARRNLCLAVIDSCRHTWGKHKLLAPSLHWKKSES